MQRLLSLKLLHLIPDLNNMNKLVKKIFYFTFSVGMISIERGAVSDPLYVKPSNTIDQLLLNGLETLLLSYCGRLIRVFSISNKGIIISWEI